jgi:NAD(P)-dependent dehydrogenase (short-subunit alcohol dehydrogenase family)
LADWFDRWRPNLPPTASAVLIPGFTENERLKAGTIDSELDSEVVASIPAGRWGTPHDVGVAAVYLADPSLAYHTGAEVVVDGAYSILPPYLAVRASRPRERGAT